jgi:transglutaminase-like putative cysteine protease
MKSIAPRLLFHLITVCFVMILPAVALAGDEWEPVNPADLSSKTATVDKDADAEAVFWKVRVADEIEGGDPRTVLHHYIRVKIFTDRGREAYSKVDIPYFTGTEIKDVAARTIKPDGSIVELKKEDLFEKTIVKVNQIKLKAKSFAMPGVETGAIVEYRWREVRNNTITFYDRFDLQRDIPVRLVEYHLKPARFETFTNVGINARTYHGNTTPFVKEKDGYYLTSMSNVPAFREEPRMPPENQLRAWMLVYYTLDENLPAEKLWPKVGREVYEAYRPVLKSTDEIRKATAEAVGDASTPEEKLVRLFNYSRDRIKNVNDDAAGFSKEERAKLKENKTPTDTLKRGSGTGEDIDVLFAAMANAAGFDARITRTSDREKIFFDNASNDRYWLNGYNVAVSLDGQWRFFDPASKYVPFGMLRWQEEGQKTLIPDPKQAIWVQTPISEPRKSLLKRTAKLTLLEDGTMEGDVEVQYNGQFATEKKEENDEDSEAKREESLTEEVKAQMSSAEITKIRIENVTDPIKPLVQAYHIRVPGYAQRTGKRLFLQPAFFQRGLKPEFSTSAREYPIYFHYPWLEEDEVSIELPAGFALDNPDAPAPFSGAPVGEYKASIGVAKDGHSLAFKRSFYFGGGGNILFPVQVYGQLKNFFNALNTQDNHTITLKQAATTAVSP